MKTLPRARKRRPLPEPPMTAVCICGHDYGSHDGKRCTVDGPGQIYPCACLGFKLATPGNVQRDNAAGWRDAGDKFIAERAARLSGRTIEAPPFQKGDSLLLLRIATALERIAEASEDNNRIASRVLESRSAPFMTSKQEKVPR